MTQTAGRLGWVLRPSAFGRDSSSTAFVSFSSADSHARRFGECGNALGCRITSVSRSHNARSSSSSRVRVGMPATWGDAHERQLL
jgi:hypothetical protein